MALNLMNKEDRLIFLNEYKNAENIDRKNKSFEQYEILNDRLNKYVTDYLLSQFSKDTVLEMPVVSSINLAKRVIDKQDCVYSGDTTREFSLLTDEQKAELEMLYLDAEINKKLAKANKYFKLQGQCLLMVLKKEDDLDIKVLLQHHYDVIPNDTNPEIADAYIISTYDRSLMMTSDNSNQSLGDKDDYKTKLERYLVWTNEANFIFDGNGNIVSEVLPNPLGNLDMFIDVAADKDFEYFVRGGSSVTDFAVQYCGALSDLGNVIKMQGYAVAFMTGDEKYLPKSITVGPNKVLLLPTDAQNPVKPEFGFASPSPDIAGSIQYIETLLSNFLTSRGLDAKLVTGSGDGQKYASGIERLLALIENFDASKSDFDLFYKVEDELFDVIKQWCAVTYNTDQKFLSFNIPEESELSVKFFEPNMIQSESEKLDNIQKKRDLGIMSRVEAIAFDRNVDEQKAIEIASKIDSEDAGMEIKLPIAPIELPEPNDEKLTAMEKLNE